VGLPPGIMGNSEVGHLTLGSGRIILQDLSRINGAIADGSFFENEPLLQAMRKAKERSGSVHLMGLLSNAGVHSSLGHLKALVKMARLNGVRDVFVHAFTDGRDTSPSSGQGFMLELAAFLKAEGVGRVATVAGRYYAMDRDRRWSRVERAYRALVHGDGLSAADGLTAILESYARDETDEFVQPTVVGDWAASRIRTGDSVIFFNFRPDRARELSAALTCTDFGEFDRGGPPPAISFVGMTEYDPDLGLAVAFPKQEPRHVLAEVLSEAGMTQLHIAETEKYAHVTFFFNGGHEEPFAGETRTLIPSPRDVATYDLKPAMSAYEVVDALEAIVAADPPNFTLVNFANPDMVGHTGDIEATVEAIGHVDRCLGRVVEILGSVGARMIITSDHGNAEAMLEPDGDANTAHSLANVPAIVLEKGLTLRQLGGLSDVAPTLLRFLGLDIPPEMTGTPLFEERVQGSVCGHQFGDTLQKQ